MTAHCFILEEGYSVSLILEDDARLIDILKTWRLTD